MPKGNCSKLWATSKAFSLEAGIEAAKLTRVAYDVFVNPLVTLAADVAGEFLNVTLQAFDRRPQSAGWTERR